MTKQELLDLIENEPIKNHFGSEVDFVGRTQFLFQNQPNSTCFFKDTWEELKISSCFLENMQQLGVGDMVYFTHLRALGVVGTATILLTAPLTDKTETIHIQETKQPNRKGQLTQFQANGYHWHFQNVSVKTLFQQLTNSRPGRLEIAGTDLPNLDVFFSSPNSDLTEAQIHEKILVALQEQYSFTIKNFYKEKTGWFLSGGEATKIQQFKEKQVIPNLEYFNKQVQKKGMESVGPMDFKWFTERYFELEHDLEVIDLTDIEGRYILPLQTKDLKSLQQQMEEDYGLVLNQEKRTVAMTVVNWQ